MAAVSNDLTFRPMSRQRKYHCLCDKDSMFFVKKSDMANTKPSYLKLSLPSATNIKEFKRRGPEDRATTLSNAKNPDIKISFQWHKIIVLKTDGCED